MLILFQIYENTNIKTITISKGNNENRQNIVITTENKLNLPKDFV